MTSGATESVDSKCGVYVECMLVACVGVVYMWGVYVVD